MGDGGDGDGLERREEILTVVDWFWDRRQEDWQKVEGNVRTPAFQSMRGLWWANQGNPNTN